jgi:hypothetical protein
VCEKEVLVDVRSRAVVLRCLSRPDLKATGGRCRSFGTASGCKVLLDALQVVECLRRAVGSLRAVKLQHACLIVSTAMLRCWCANESNIRPFNSRVSKAVHRTKCATALALITADQDDHQAIDITIRSSHHRSRSKL